MVSLGAGITLPAFISLLLIKRVLFLLNFVNDCTRQFMRIFYLCKKVSKDQESIQSSATPDPGYQLESDNVTNRHHKREPRGQPFLSR